MLNGRCEHNNRDNHVDISPGLDSNVTDVPDVIFVLRSAAVTTQVPHAAVPAQLMFKHALPISREQQCGAELWGHHIPTVRCRCLESQHAAPRRGADQQVPNQAQLVEESPGKASSPHAG